MEIRWSYLKYFLLGMILGTILLLAALTGWDPDRMFPMKEDSPYKKIYSSIMKQLE